MTQRIAMGGQKVPIFHKLRSGWQTWQEHRTDAWGGVAAYEKRFEYLSQLMAQYVGRPIARSRILEVGCGQRAVMPLLFAAHGAEAYGIDVEVPTYRLDLHILLKVLRVNGFERALKSLTRNVLIDPGFFKELENAIGSVLPFSEIHIKTMDAAGLDLKDDNFDLLFSFAVLEHVADVVSAVHHMNRVLKPDGIGAVSIHLFSSLSGGHCMDWQHVESRPSSVVPLWDHLLENRYPVNLFLNKLKLQDYRNIFYSSTEVVRETLTKEGEDLVHLAPPSLLERYAIEDLTTSGVGFIFRKKTPSFNA